MSIFGKGRPVVELIINGSVIELPFTSLYPTFVDKRIIENESPLDGTRTWITLFNQAEFSLTVHLHGSDDSESYFNNLRVLEDAEVYFKPHKFTSYGSLADYIKDKDGLNVAFRCTQFEPFYLNNVHHFDCLNLTFKSSKPVVLNSDILGMLPVQ